MKAAVSVLTFVMAVYLVTTIYVTVITADGSIMIGLLLGAIVGWVVVICLRATWRKP